MVVFIHNYKSELITILYEAFISEKYSVYVDKAIFEIFLIVDRVSLYLHYHANSRFSDI